MGTINPRKRRRKMEPARLKGCFDPQFLLQSKKVISDSDKRTRFDCRYSLLKEFSYPEYMKTFSLVIVFSLMTLFAFIPESRSQVYKYVDEKGVTHFTNTPVDPRYRPASRSINRKASPRQSNLKIKRHSESKPLKGVNRLKNPPGHPN